MKGIGTRKREVIVLEVAGMFEGLPNSSFDIKALGQGNYRIKKQDGTMEFDVATRNGFLASNWVVRQKDGGPDVQMKNASWKNKGGIWYVDSIVEEFDVRFNGGDLQRYTLHYDSFEPNCEVPPDLFTLDALNLSTNSRIIDQRTGARQKSYYPGKKLNEGEKQLDGIVQQLEAVPFRQTATQAGRPWSNWTLFLWAMAALLSIGLALVLWRRRRAKKTLAN